jgi:hypothetical protein
MERNKVIDEFFKENKVDSELPSAIRNSFFRRSVYGFLFGNNA